MTFVPFLGAVNDSVHYHMNVIERKDASVSGLPGCACMGVWEHGTLNSACTIKMCTTNGGRPGTEANKTTHKSWVIESMFNADGLVKERSYQYIDSYQF